MKTRSFFIGDVSWINSRHLQLSPRLKQHYYHSLILNLFKVLQCRIYDSFCGHHTYQNNMISGTMYKKFVLFETNKAQVMLKEMFLWPWLRDCYNYFKKKQEWVRCKYIECYISFLDHSFSTWTSHWIGWCRECRVQVLIWVNRSNCISH